MNRERCVGFLLVLMISMATFKVMMQLHGQHLNDLADAAFGVLVGKPHWIGFQNRLLGPFLVNLVSMTGIDRPSAIVIFMLITIFVQNLLLFELMSRARASIERTLGSLAIFSFIFLFVQHYWFYTWDSIDLIIFTLFAWGIYARKTVSFFLLLFLVAILNRESALFIALYLMIDAFQTAPGAKGLLAALKSLRLTSAIKLVTGILLMVSGMAYIKIVRTMLFVSTLFGGDDRSHAAIGNHFYLWQNIKDLFFYNLLSLDVANSLFIIGSTLYMALSVNGCYEGRAKAFLIYLALVVNIMIFGFLNETRLYLILIPFLIFSRSAAGFSADTCKQEPHGVT